MRYILLNIFLSFILITDSYAQVTADPGNTAGEVANWLTKVSEDATEAVQPVAKEYKSIKQGISGAIESSKTIQEAKKKYEQAKEKIEKAKALYEKKKAEVEEISAKVKDAKGKVEKGVEKGKSAYEKAEAVKEYAEGVKAIESLKEERKLYIESETARNRSTIEALKDNNALYNKRLSEEMVSSSNKESENDYQKLIKQNDEAIAELEANISVIESSDVVKEYDKQIAEQQEKIKKSQEKVDAYEKEAKEKALNEAKSIGTGILAGVISGAGAAAAAYAAATADNFVKEGEAPGGEVIDKIIKKRKQAIGKDTIDVYVSSLEMVQQMKENDDMVKDLGEKMAEVDDAQSAVLTETSGIRVKAMQNLLQFIKLQLAELKMETARDMMRLPYEYKNKEKFNFDDYIFTEKDAKGIKSSGSIIDQAKSVKETAEKAVEDGKKAKDKVDELKNKK